MGKEPYSIKDLSKKIGITKESIYNFLSRKQYDKLPPFYKVNGKYLFDKSDVDAWLQERRVDVYAEKRKQQSEGAKDGQ